MIATTKEQNIRKGYLTTTFIILPFMSPGILSLKTVKIEKKFPPKRHQGIATFVIISTAARENIYAIHFSLRG